MEKQKFDNFKIPILVFLVLILITLSTNYYGSTDINSFTSPAKYFAGMNLAKIRSSHSYLWGFLNFPFVKLFHSFIGFKILNLIILASLIYSVYYISRKNKKALFLMLLSPIVWYMAPWVNSIQISSLLFLWCYFFIQKYENLNKLKHLFYSGIFFGLAAIFWHAIFFFGIFLIIFFFYNKKALHLFYYLISIFIGLIPLFILDYFLFGFPFHSLIKNVVGTSSNLLGLGVYSQEACVEKSFFVYLSLFLVIPFYFWFLYKSKYFKKNIKTMLFLTSSLLIVAKNPQIRYLLLIVPIMILNLIKVLDNKQIKKLLIFSAIISLLVVLPYEIQIKYHTNAPEFGLLINNFFNWEINKTFPEDLIKQDLDKISKDYPNKIFVVGNAPDYYQFLADLYWGKSIKEFVSIQDYNLFLKNTSTLTEREVRFSPENINGRREFWIKGGIGKPLNDDTDYKNINLGIGINEPIDINGFKVIKKYNSLYLSKRYY